MSNYAIINGKRIELTDEQVKALGIKKTNPFDRLGKGDVYYFIRYLGDVDEYTEANDAEDDALFKCCNYFNDDSVAQQVALHQLLYRMLLKFAYDNECEDDREWDSNNLHYYIFYNHIRDMFGIRSDYDNKSQQVYFSSDEGALRAIREVVKPFMKEHPDFVW